MLEAVLSEREVLSSGKLQSWQLEAILSTIRVRTLVVGRQSGKSTTLRTICLKEMLERPGIDVLYLAPTIKQVKAIGFRPMFLSNDPIFPKRLVKEINKTDMSVTLINGSRIVFAGTEAVDKLRGLTCDLLILDEYAIMEEQVLTSLEPIISARNGRIVIAGTPIGMNHFYDIARKGVIGSPTFTRGYRTWIKPISDPTVVLPNKQVRIDNAKSTLSPSAYEQEYECSFTTAAGLVYPQYDMELNRSVMTLDATRGLFIGMDFNVALLCAVIGQRVVEEILDHNGNKKKVEHLHIIEEIVLENSNTQAMADEINRRYSAKWKNRILVYPDASGSARKTSANKNSTDHSILRQAGFSVETPKSNPEIVDRVNQVNAKMCNAHGERQLFINQSCQYMVKSLTAQSYNKHGKPEKGSGVSDLSGPPDALGYLVNVLYPIGGSKFSVSNAFGYQ